MFDLVELDRVEMFGGFQLTYQHESYVTNSSMKFSLYLPPKHSQASVKLPLLYYLSGAGSNEQVYVQQSGFQEYAAKHNIVVCGPDTSPRVTGNDCAS